MIQIKSWFPDQTRNDYYNEILNCLPKQTSEIPFLLNYKIPFKTLLTGTRKEVLAFDGIPLYIALCRFMALLGNNFAQADYLEFLFQSFPQDIECTKANNQITYTIKNNTNNDVTTATVIKQKGKRIVNGNSKMPDFFYYFFTQINSQQSLSLFKDFIKIAKQEVHLLLNATMQNITGYINYDWMPDSLRHKILASINIKCCPYCNRQYITVWFDKNNKKHATADLDHYYPKSNYPLFALSLFNFIPSCQICNSRMKVNRELETLYPYEEGMDAFRFRCFPIKPQPDSLVNLWVAYKSKDFKGLLQLYQLMLANESDSQLSPELQAHIDRCNRSIEMFHLDKVYQTHLDAAINEMLKIHIYLSGHYQTCAKNTLNAIGLDANNQWNGFSKEEMRDIILGFVYDGHDNIDQPLGKLLSDIFENEMKLLYKEQKHGR